MMMWGQKEGQLVIRYWLANELTSLAWFPHYSFDNIILLTYALDKERILSELLLPPAKERIRNERD